MAHLAETEKARYVNRMFGRIARRYDWGNRVLSLGRDQSWRRVAVAALSPQPGDTVLDIGAGTGDLSLALARRAGRVLALDFSAPMVAAGARKVRRRRHGEGIGFVRGDALRLPFTDAAFDGAAAAFTVRNFARLEDGLREIRRVLKPGGRFVCLEFTLPPSRLVWGMYRPYLRHVVPLVGGRITGDASAYRYLSDSIQAFPNAGSLADSMRQAGFAAVRWRLLNFGTVAIHVAECAMAGSPAQQGAAA
jgi:demethylmenaquinone methyltransferase/2-methoxy-6-polyprenyl-1,4-benzoquinol methylase